MQKPLSDQEHIRDRAEVTISEHPYLLTTYSLSVILPAHNEAVAIQRTVSQILDVLSSWIKDFEVIVVNDGSKDQTGPIIEQLALNDGRLRIVTHAQNQGYGAALISGFQTAQKDLAFFMDSDGQFDIHDLQLFFPYIDRYDAVLGYRMDRKDSWIRKVNAWGWKQVVKLTLGVRVRDLDCAFKLYRTDFVHQHQFESRGAMINAEMLYKFRRDGYTFKEIGVHHLPRSGGQATGANFHVIMHAFKELFYYSHKWRHE